MERNFAVVTIFALLFAVTTARISLVDPTPSVNEVHSNSNIVLPSEQTKTTRENYNVPNKKEPENDQTFKVDLTPRSEFARFHAINRHFFDEPRNSHRYAHHSLYKHFVIPKPETSYENNVGRQRLQGPLKRMKFRKKRQHHHQHHHQRHRYHHHIHRDTNDMFNMKHKFDHDKVKRAAGVVHQQHKEMKTQHEAGFMRSIRKFLKHSFE